MAQKAKHWSQHSAIILINGAAITRPHNKKGHHMKLSTRGIAFIGMVAGSATFWAGVYFVTKVAING